MLDPRTIIALAITLAKTSPEGDEFASNKGHYINHAHSLLRAGIKYEPTQLERLATKIAYPSLTELTIGELLELAA